MIHLSPIDYAESLAAVMRIWSTRSLPRSEVMDMLGCAGLTEAEAADVLSIAVARGILGEEADGLHAAAAPPPQPSGTPVVRH